MNISNVVINPNNCMSRKNRKDAFHLQCTNKKKFGDYCGIHHKSSTLIRIDQAIPANPSPVPIVSQQNVDPSNLNPNLNSVNPNLNSVNNTAGSDNTSQQIPSKKPEDIKSPQSPKPKKLVLKRRANNPYYTPQDDLSNIDKINYQKLTKTLQKYRINIIGGIPTQIDRLKDFFSASYLGEFPEKTTPEELKKVQKFVDVSGEALFNRSLCQNPDDFFNLEPLDEIPHLYFFTFVDKNDRIYGCDIRSFDGYIYSYKEPGQETPFDPENLNVLNPYDRQPISKQSMTNYIAKKYLLFQNGISCSHHKEEFDSQTAFKMKILDLFQIIYRFGYPVDHRWLLNLTNDRLFSFYLKLEDIWNFRLGLTEHAKKQIVGNSIIFTQLEKIKANLYHKKMDRDKLLELCVTNMEILITKGKTKNDCITGSNYVLMALVEVSQQAGENLPQFAFAIGINDDL